MLQTAPTHHTQTHTRMHARTAWCYLFSPVFVNRLDHGQAQAWDKFGVGGLGSLMFDKAYGINQEEPRMWLCVVSGTCGCTTST